MNIKRLSFLTMTAAALIMVPFPASAQDMMSDDMQEWIGAAKVDRNLLVSNNMQLSDAEAKIFWPVYQDYLDDLAQVNRNFAEVIQSYVFALRSDSLSDDTAKQLTDQFLTAQDEEVKLRQAYAGKLAKVLPGKTVARALQLENKIRAAAWFGLASQIPLAKQ